MSLNSNPVVCLSPSFISKLLLDTIQHKNIRVHLSKGVEIQERYKLNTIDKAELIALFDKNSKIYLNSEDSLSDLETSSKNTETLENIRFFKDKFLFKSCFADQTSFIRELSKDELSSFVPPENRHLIVKPAIGFHSLGIRDFQGLTQWNKISSEIVEEVESFGEVFNQGVLSSSRFLIEDYLEGIELACDAYFDSMGEPVITGIYEHPFLNSTDTRDLVYHTSRQLVEKYYQQFLSLLNTISGKKKLLNFPLHLEARYNNGSLIPIEGNPLRFGGFGLSDLPSYAFAFNPYLMYFKDTRPNWESILNSRDTHHYAFVVGQRPDNFDPEQHRVDHQSYQNTFHNILDYREIDTSKYRFFSTTYAKSANLEDLTSYLAMDFNQFKMDSRA